jgi:hypothetical protein
MSTKSRPTPREFNGDDISSNDGNKSIETLNEWMALPVMQYKSYSPSNLKDMLQKCIKYRIPVVEKRSTMKCPLCNLSFYEETLMNKHFLRRHTKKEIENYLHFNQAQSGNDHINIQWIGDYTIVPPLPSPIPIEICYNHVPPHPKCLKCNESINKYPFFPPLRFYSSAFFQYDARSTNDEKYGKIFTFHFNMNNQDLGIVMGNGRIAQIQSICEDRFERNFLGVKYYFSYAELLNYLPEKDTSATRKKLNVLDKEYELVLDSRIDWVNMTNVKDRCLVFKCNKAKFTEIRENMVLSRESNQCIKFCRFRWTGTALVDMDFSF